MSYFPRQLALALDHAESYARDDFLSGPSNAATLALVERWPDWPTRSVALVGPQGAGKSHLAAIWAEISGARFLAGRALEGADLPGSLATGALVIEDAAAATGDERALFHLLNLAREEEAFVLLTSSVAPAAWPVQIRDLGSRLRALPVVTLMPPDDALLRAVIVKLCADRHLAVDESFVAYLVTRIERSFAAARDAVLALDHEALRQQRPLTRALAVEMFGASS
ncbi:MAG: chromosomal replication initiator DnaA [Steroidobacteraceae bacterium]